MAERRNKSEEVSVESLLAGIRETEASRQGHAVYRIDKNNAVLLAYLLAGQLPESEDESDEKNS